MSERIGFFICHCGINIASRVRVKEVAAYAATFPGVLVSQDYLFMCSDPGQDLIEKEIKNQDLTRCGGGRLFASHARKDFSGRLPEGGVESLSGLSYGLCPGTWLLGDGKRG